ncbi:MAG: Fe(2+)-trafficking protein [Planctomycetes bacterium]|nr:Fe(2+)-trafficking protein [Planctomycetota bacterium]
MAKEDPDNELGHFSLGKACLDAGMPKDAIAPLARAIELKATLSKAYQLLGEAHDRAGQRAKAIDVLTRGVKIADAQGDRMPRDAMAKMLRDWGAPVPEFKSASAGGSTAGDTGSVSATGFHCTRCGRPTGQLAKPPFKGEIGSKIYDHICQSCWREWIGMGTKVINELGLVLSTQSGQQAYDQYMLEFLQLE